MLLVPVPWAGRVWALPFLSILAPSERYAAERGKHHKKTTDWARQMLLLVRRWWPEREIVAVADSAYASLRLLASCRRFLPKPVTFITRLRLDAALYDPAPPRRTGQMGRPRLKGERLPNLSVVAEDPSTAWAGATPWRTGTVVRSVLWRWLRELRSGTAQGIASRCHTLGSSARSARRVQNPSLAVHRPRRRTRADRLLVCLALADGDDLPGSASAPLGVETQRQWSDLAIRRTTPVLLGLFSSLITVFAHQRMARSMQAVQRAAWYRKPRPTFSDALALVRKELWAHTTFRGSPAHTDTVKVPREFVEHLTETLCYAA